SRFIAYPLESHIAVVAADAALAQEKVAELMQQRQTPSGSGIRLIDDDERSNWVGQCESTKDLRAEIGGVMSQVAHEDYEDARLFNFLAQISERIVGGP